MLLACAAPFGLNGYGLYLLTLTEIFALVALGLNLLTGYAGQISLCHAAFFGVGAYATAILTQKAGRALSVVAVRWARCSRRRSGRWRRSRRFV